MGAPVQAVSPVMPSLTQLLTSHDRLLVLDAASMTVQAGLWRTGQPARWCNCREEAGSGIFTNTKSLLDEAGLRISDIGAFVFPCTKSPWNTNRCAARDSVAK